jgi:DNA-binding response OmpR family regulator
MVVDSPGASARLKQFLETNGYRVMEASTVENAIEEAGDFTGRARPDLILMKYDPMARDQTPAVRLLREGAGLPDVPVLAISDHDGPDHRGAAIAAGYSEYLAEPISFAELKNHLRSFLPERRAPT